MNIKETSEHCTPVFAEHIRMIAQRVKDTEPVGAQIPSLEAVKLSIALKWLEDIRKVGSATSMLATAAMHEIEAIESQYPLGINTGEGKA